jgi:[Skp1-protein]-hydroxyproline N-acetylglucosaminyltransferase
MRLVKGWDTLLKQYIFETANPLKSIITVYPRGYKREKYEHPKELEGPLAMCFKEFSKIDGFPRFSSRIIKKEDRFTKPFHSLFWAAGFSFSFGTILADCGYTSELDDVFFGEELYLMWKFWSAGY